MVGTPNWLPMEKCVLQLHLELFTPTITAIRMVAHRVRFHWIDNIRGINGCILRVRGFIRLRQTQELREWQRTACFISDLAEECGLGLFRGLTAERSHSIVPNVRCGLPAPAGDWILLSRWSWYHPSSLNWWVGLASWRLSVRALGSLGPLRCLAPRPLRTWSGRGRSRCIETLQNQSVQGRTVQKPRLCPRRQSLKLHCLILPLASGLGLQMGQMLWSWNEPENMFGQNQQKILLASTYLHMLAWSS